MFGLAKYLVRFINDPPEVIKHVLPGLQILLPSLMNLNLLSEVFDAFCLGSLFKIIDLLLEPFIQCVSLLVLIAVPFDLTFTTSEPFLEVADLLFLGGDIFTYLFEIHSPGLFCNLTLQFLHFPLQPLDVASHRLNLCIKPLGAFEILDVHLKFSFLLFQLSFLSTDVCSDDLGSTDAVNKPEHIKSVLVDLQNHPALRREECNLLGVPPLAVLIKECVIR